MGRNDNGQRCWSCHLGSDECDGWKIDGTRHAAINNPDNEQCFKCGTTTRLCKPKACDRPKRGDAGPKGSADKGKQKPKITPEHEKIINEFAAFNEKMAEVKPPDAGGAGGDDDVPSGPIQG